MGDFARPASTPLVLSSTAVGETTAEMKPAVMVERDSKPSDPMPVAAGAQPPPLPVEPATPTVAASEPSKEPKSKLLTPEEKAQVIAELEALAKSQEAGRPADKPECADGTAMALESEERLKRDLASGEC